MPMLDHGVQEAEEEMKLQGGALPRPWSVGQGVGDVGPSISEAGQAPAAWQAAHSAQVCLCLHGRVLRVQGVS